MKSPHVKSPATKNAVREQTAGSSGKPTISLSELTDLTGEGYLAFSPGTPDALVQDLHCGAGESAGQPVVCGLAQAVWAGAPGGRNPR